MEISGEVIAILGTETGTGKNGEWKKRDFVIKTNEQYPKKIWFTEWKNFANFKPGDTVKVMFNVESREFNSKWYTNLTAFSVQIESQGNLATTENVTISKVETTENTETISSDDLPF